MDLTKYAKPISFKNKSKIGVLVIHGFTSTTSSIEYIAEKFNKAGFNVEAPSLSGHGTTWQDLNKTKYKDWLNDVENALEKLKKHSSKVFIAGLSMGGALALYLAQNHPEICGVILINHALFLKGDWRLPLIPIMKHFIPYDKAVAGDIKDPNSKEMAYDRVPLKGAAQFFKLIKMVKSNLKNVYQPLLIFKSVEDHVIPMENAHYTVDHASSQFKEIYWLKESYHVATLDNDKNTIAAESISFIKNIIKQGDNI